MQDKKPDLSFFHVFGSLCYPTNDYEDQEKFDAKADIGIFVGYTPAKKAFRIYNKRTQIITETIHVTFDELSAMAFEQFSSGLELHYMTPSTSSTDFSSNLVSQQPCLPPIRDDWDCLFQPMLDEYFNPPPIAVSPVQEAAALRAEVLVDSPASTSIDQDAPSTSIPASQEQEHSPIISQDSTAHGSSSNVIQIHTPFEHLGRWTKDHPIANVIVEPKNFKQAMTEPSWIDVMQEEIHEFERLKVWELVLCLDKVFLIKLKWIYKDKTDESGVVDPTLFTWHARNDILLVQIYVYDIIFASTNTAMYDEFANQMTNKFKMSIMGQMSFFLGLQISQSPRGIFINQSKYASKIVKKYGLHSIDSVDTPMIENKKLDEDLQGKPVDAILYRGMIGSIMYLTSCRPDLNHDVCLCAQY
ncbi:retrovirus-related pol polyprotein from transposon TNT 1-94 [Tanacetum coccineum]